MSTDVVTVSSLILAKLQTVSGLNAVYEYQPAKSDNGKYPYASVTPVTFAGEFADTIRNKRTYEFAVRVFQERNKATFGNEKAERIMRELIDAILTAFDNDTTLNGAVKWITPVRGDLSYEVSEVGDTRICEIILEVHTMVDSIN